MPPRKILMMKLRSLGDTILMTAPLEEIKKAYPEAEIHLAVMASWAPLFEEYPGVSRIWTYERRKEPAARAKTVARMALKLRQEHFECVINLHASPSSAMIAFATGARTRSIHFHGHQDRNRYSTVTIPGKGMVKPVIERDMDTIRALGLHVPAGRMPILFLDSAEKNLMEGWFKSLSLPGPVLGMGLGSSRPTKCWPIERFAALAVLWCVKRQGSVFVPVAEQEGDLLHQFLKEVEDQLTATVVNPQERAVIRARIITEKGLPVRRLAAALNRISVFAGNDSGPKHIAVAVNTPTVTLFGPEDPFEWHPYPKQQHPYFFIDGLSCRKDSTPGLPPWCGLNSCVEEQHQCMRNIGVNEVFEAAVQVARRG